MSYGSGKEAPSDAIDVGLQKSYDSLKSVPVREVGARTIDSDHNQTPKSAGSTDGYFTGGNKLGTP